MVEEVQARGNPVCSRLPSKTYAPATRKASCEEKRCIGSEDSLSSKGELSGNEDVIIEEAASRVKVVALKGHSFRVIEKSMPGRRGHLRE